jgi:hypothetical protein
VPKNTIASPACVSRRNYGLDPLVLPTLALRFAKKTDTMETLFPTLIEASRAVTDDLQSVGSATWGEQPMTATFDEKSFRLLFRLSRLVFGAFVAYQLFRFQVTQSLWLMAITILDIVVIAMTWHEYQFLRRRIRTPANA